MNSRSDRTLAALAGALMLPAAAAGQEAPANGTVGAPELRGFRLPGTRVTPPPTTQTPPPPAPAPPPVAEPRVETARPATRAPAAVRPQAQAAPRAADASPARSAVTIAPAAVPAADEIPTIPLATPPAGELAADEPAPTSRPAQLQPPTDSDSSEWSGTLWPALAVGLGLLAAFVFLRRRRAVLAGDGPVMERSAQSLDSAISAPAAAPPAPARRPAQLREDDEELRPALVFEFKPERMVATDAQASVHFALLVRNSGQGPARNVQIEARMFNASAQQAQEIAAFLATPARTDEASASLVLQPQQSTGARAEVVMPKESVREIHIDGRPLFIPTVVVRAVYQWGRGRSGQAHGSYLVGIQNEKSPEKMGPFRLDLGPRIYRSVAGRQIQLARAS